MGKKRTDVMSMVQTLKSTFNPLGSQDKLLFPAEQTTFDVYYCVSLSSY